MPKNDSINAGPSPLQIIDKGFNDFCRMVSTLASNPRTAIWTDKSESVFNNASLLRLPPLIIASMVESHHAYVD